MQLKGWTRQLHTRTSIYFLVMDIVRELHSVGVGKEFIEVDLLRWKASTRRH